VLDAIPTEHLDILAVHADRDRYHERSSGVTEPLVDVGVQIESGGYPVELDEGGPEKVGVELGCVRHLGHFA